MTRNNYKLSNSQLSIAVNIMTRSSLFSFALLGFTMSHFVAAATLQMPHEDLANSPARHAPKMPSKSARIEFLAKATMKNARGLKEAEFKGQKSMLRVLNNSRQQLRASTMPLATKVKSYVRQAAVKMGTYEECPVLGSDERNIELVVSKCAGCILNDEQCPKTCCGGVLEGSKASQLLICELGGWSVFTSTISFEKVTTRKLTYPLEYDSDIVSCSMFFFSFASSKLHSIYH